METKFVNVAKLHCTLVITDIMQLSNGVLINSHTVVSAQGVYAYFNTVNICLGE
jgi:hypothetical protein